eukprot:5929518-Prymnesium_polylepis.1
MDLDMCMCMSQPAWPAATCRLQRDRGTHASSRSPTRRAGEVGSLGNVAHARAGAPAARLTRAAQAAAATRALSPCCDVRLAPAQQTLRSSNTSRAATNAALRTTSPAT